MARMMQASPGRHADHICKLTMAQIWGVTKGLAAEWREQHCWHPNQLRHTAATRIRAAYGIELARIILGHSSAVTSEIYAEIDREKAKEVMGRMG